MRLHRQSSRERILRAVARGPMQHYQFRNLGLAGALTPLVRDGLIVLQFGEYTITDAGRQALRAQQGSHA